MLSGGLTVEGELSVSPTGSKRNMEPGSSQAWRAHERSGTLADPRHKQGVDPWSVRQSRLLGRVHHLVLHRRSGILRLIVSASALRIGGAAHDDGCAAWRDRIHHRADDGCGSANNGRGREGMIVIVPAAVPAVAVKVAGHVDVVDVVDVPIAAVVRDIVAVVVDVGISGAMVDVACRLAPDLPVAGAAIGSRCAPTASTVGGCRTPATAPARRATATASPTAAPTPTAASSGSGDKEVTAIGAVLHGRLNEPLRSAVTA